MHLDIMDPGCAFHNLSYFIGDHCQAWCQFYLFLQIQTLLPDPHEDFYYNSCYPVLIKHFALSALLLHKSI